MLVGAVAAFGLLASLRYAGGLFIGWLETTGSRPWERGAWVSLADADLVSELQGTLLRGLLLLAPWLGILIVCAIGLHWLQAGWMFRPERLVEGGTRLFHGAGDATERGGRAAWGFLQMVAVVSVAAWRVHARVGDWNRRGTN